jgi:hypothetical protein
MPHYFLRYLLNPFKLFFKYSILLLAMTSCGGGGGSSSPKPASTPPATPVAAPDPILKSVELGEMTGRPGHQGVFPFQGEPTAGPAYVIVTTEGNVSALSIDVQSNSNTMSNGATTPDEISEVVSNNLKVWNIEVDLPSGEFTLLITMTTSDGKEIFETIGKQTTNDFKLKLGRNDFEFSYGENTVRASISNYGDAANFIVTATDNYGFVQSQFEPAQLFINTDEVSTVDIPINLSPEQTVGGIYDYEIIIEAKVIDSPRNNTAKMSIDISENPIALKDIHKLIVINPGYCDPVNVNSPTLQAVIAGSSKVVISDVDTESITWMNGKVKPISAEIDDIVSFDNHHCGDINPDGKNDLVMTFSLQDILNYNPDRDYSIGWPAYISYVNTDGIGGSVFRFSMDVLE